jgi:hypothetical protein
MKLAAFLISALALGACDSDAGDSPTPDVATGAARDFRLRIENVAPWRVLKVSTQRTSTEAIEGPIGPDQAYVIRFTAGKGHHVSFATMLRQSNDWFFAPGAEGIPLFADDGRPISGDVTRYVRLWDAGTELDQEPGVGNATGARQSAANVGEPDPNPLVREVPLQVRLSDGSTFVRPATADMIRVTLTHGPDNITLRIENRSTDTTLVTSQGEMAIELSPVTWTVHRFPAPLFTPDAPARENGLESLAEAGLPDALASSLGYARGFATGLSPGVAVVHSQPAPLFDVGMGDRGLGLERLAEDGDHVPLLEALRANPPPGVSAVVGFDAPEHGEPGPAAPGQAFEVIVHGGPGDAVSFATMFAMSNDWFFASHPEGIALFDGDIPRSCDVTAEVVLYDLGTEIDEELDIGPNTAPQQLEPDSGRADRFPEVREVTIERYGQPEVLHLRVMLQPL